MATAMEEAVTTQTGHRSQWNWKVCREQQQESDAKMLDDLFTFTTISSTAGESLFSLSTPQSDLLRKYLQEKIRHH